MTNHPNRGPKGPLSHPPSDLVRELREHAALTQERFGALVHASRRIVQDWEGGQRRVPQATFELLCLALVVGSFIAPGEWLRPWVRADFIVFFQRRL